MADQPKRIQLRRTKSWRKPEGVVSVVRGTDWGNPFKVGARLRYEHDLPNGDVYVMDCSPITAELAVALFKAWMIDRGFIDQAARELRGKDLACWCKIGDPCHGDWLLEIANSEAS